jgi:hypothetical protein
MFTSVLFARFGKASQSRQVNKGKSIKARALSHIESWVMPKPAIVKIR